LHKLLDNYLKGYTELKFNGSDLAIVIGDIIYAMSIDTFLAIGEKPQNKLRALKKFVEVAIYTGGGEYVELMAGLKDIDQVSRRDIYKIYDFKTAYYTFCSPLIVGAILAGAAQSQIDKLNSYGINLGRAFQIQDDILDMFGTEKEIGKSCLTDIKEGKKTLVLWNAYRKAGKKSRETIKKCFCSSRLAQKDLLAIRKIVTETGALEQTKQEVRSLARKARDIALTLEIKPAFKKLLASFPDQVIKI
jgi:geranylgeranyl diphosphate synthase type I